MMFIPLKDAWELFPRLFTPPFTMIHRHPAAVIKICIILGLMCAFCAGITIWLFRVRMKPTLSIDLANQVFEFADATGLTPAKAMPMSAITGLRTRTAPTFRRQLTFVEVGVQKGRSNKTEWRSFALLPSLTEAQMVMDEISVFTRIPIAS